MEIGIILETKDWDKIYTVVSDNLFLISMTTRINPPSLNSTKSYERFKQELSAWREITELKKEKQGIAVALSLPEDDVNRIKDKVFDQISLDDLKSADGLDILLTFLDKHLGKDDLSDSVEKFDEFDDCQRKEGQTIQEFIGIFDSLYRKIEKKGMKLPPEILAFKLLKKANITKDEKLLKFKGDDLKTNGNVSIKLEPAYLAENEDILLAAGYVRNKRFQGERRPKHHQDVYEKRNNSPAPSRKMNPLGQDGKTLRCKACGSFRHMLPECPDSWENMEKL